MTLTRNRFLRIYKLKHGYLGVINLGNKELQFGLKLTKPRYFALVLTKKYGEYKTLIKIGDFNG
jgi:hypothetical protein